MSDVAKMTLGNVNDMAVAGGLKKIESNFVGYYAQFKNYVKDHPVTFTIDVLSLIGSIGTLSYVCYTAHSAAVKYMVYNGYLKRESTYLTEGDMLAMKEAPPSRPEHNPIVSFIKALSGAAVVVGGMNFLADLSQTELYTWIVRLLSSLKHLLPAASVDKDALHDELGRIRSEQQKHIIAAADPSLSEDERSILDFKIMDAKQAVTRLQKQIDGKLTWADRFEHIIYEARGMFAEVSWGKVAAGVIVSAVCICTYLGFGFYMGGKDYYDAACTPLRMARDWYDGRGMQEFSFPGPLTISTPPLEPQTTLVKCRGGRFGLDDVIKAVRDRENPSSRAFLNSLGMSEDDANWVFLFVDERKSKLRHLKELSFIPGLTREFDVGLWLDRDEDMIDADMEQWLEEEELRYARMLARQMDDLASDYDRWEDSLTDMKAHGSFDTHGRRASELLDYMERAERDLSDWYEKDSTFLEI